MSIILLRPSLVSAFFGDPQSKVYYYGADALFTHHPRVVQRFPDLELAQWDAFGNQTWFAGKSSKFPPRLITSTVGGFHVPCPDLCLIYMAGLGKASKKARVFYGGVRDSMKNKPGSLKSTWFCVECRCWLDVKRFWQYNIIYIYAVWSFKTMGKAGIEVT